MIKQIYEEEMKIDMVNKCKLHLEPIKSESESDAYVYQYRALDSFWSIIESDSFWATNARFSNDNEEQLLGQKKIQALLAGIENCEQDTAEFLGDCYIVCFCDDGDRLSQWRGYANEGVAIGFDFRNIRPFYVKIKSGNKKENYICIYNSCYKVQYITEDTTELQFAERFRLSSSTDKNNLNLLKKKASDIIPYVKHLGFAEEAESRLMFSDNDYEQLEKCIHYRDINGIKVPYIIVKAGAPCKKKQCIVRLNMPKEVGQEFEKKLTIWMKKHYLPKVKIVNCFDLDLTETDDRACYGCSLRNTYTIDDIQDRRCRCRYHNKTSENGYYASCSGEIYLSDSQKQEYVCNILHNFLKENEEYNYIKIWCEGHLPVRRIRVGNLKSKEVIMESIKHYCRHKYWLRSVDVVDSKTPYRSKLI